VKNVALALVWVLLSLISLSTVALATLVVLALGRHAHDQASAVWLWVLALFLTLGMPLVLAAWKHAEDPRRISTTMAWLPAVWNVGAIVFGLQLVPIRDITADALRDVEWVAQGRLGDAHPATRAMSAFGHEAADRIDPDFDDALEIDPTQPVFGARARVDVDRAIVVPFEEAGTAIVLDVELAGPDGEVTAKYLFDTGASFTTITRTTANALGIDVPDDAPTLSFNTATGRRESRMVYLDAVSVEGVRIEGLLVSVCDTCANERTDGLLGLNVTREFVVEMDYQSQRMRLAPRLHDGPPNRAYDIEPVIQMQTEGRPEIWLGRVRWVVTVENQGSRPLRDVIPRVEFTTGVVLYGAPIAEIPAHSTGRSLVEGKVAERDADQEVEFTLTLAEGHW